MRLFALIVSLAALLACDKTPATSSNLSPRPSNSINTAGAQAALTVPVPGLDEVELPRVPAAVTGAAGIGAPSSIPNQPDFSSTTASATASPPVAESGNPNAPANKTTDETTSGFPTPAISADFMGLPNGLKVILLPDPSLPQVYVHVAYNVGSRDEEVGKTGINKLTEFLMYQGSQHAPGPLFPRLEKAGVNLTAQGADSWVDEDRSSFFTSAPSTSLEHILWLESDRMGFLTESLDKDLFEKVREAVISDRRQQLSRPAATYAQLIARHLYPSRHPYSHTPYGHETDLRALTLDEVKAWHKLWYAPNNATLTVAGQFEAETTKSLIAKYFASIPASPVRGRTAFDPGHLDRDIVMNRYEPIPQPKITFSWHTPGKFSQDEVALKLAAIMLGGGANARLTQQLVFEKKLATRVAAVQESRDLSGIFAIEIVALDETKIPEIERHLAETLANFAKDGPTSSELDGAKASFELNMLSALERIGGRGGRADWLSQYAVHYGDPRKFESDIARHMTATKTDIATAANRWLVTKPQLKIRYLRDNSAAVTVSSVDRQVEPKLDGQVELNLPSFVSKTLDNGLTLHIIRRPGLPKVESALIIKKGDLAESEATAGTSFLTATALMRGTKTRSFADILAQLALLGADMTSEGSKFGSAVTLSVVKRNFDAATELLADTVRNPSFPPSDVSAMREILATQIKQEQANRQKLADDIIPRILFAGGHAAGIPDRGLEASLAKIEASNLAQNHAKFWIPNNAAWLVVGDITEDEAEKIANKHFGNWQRGPEPNASSPIGSSPGVPYTFLIDAPEAKDVQVRIAGVASGRYAADAEALQIVNFILGGSYGSRMVTTLREAQIQAQNVYSQLLQTPLSGYWVAAATVSPKDVVTTVQALQKAISGLAGAQPDTSALREEEIADAKRVLSRKFLSNFETQAQTLQQTAPLIVDGRDAQTLSASIRKLVNESPESLTATVRKFHALDRAITVIIGDLKQFEENVAASRQGETLVLSPDVQVLRKVDVPEAGGATSPSASISPDMAPGIVPPGPIHSSVPNHTPQPHDAQQSPPRPNEHIPATLPTSTPP